MSEETTHKGTWHYAVPRGRNKGQERCDFFGSDCPYFLHTDHAEPEGTFTPDDSMGIPGYHYDPPKGDQK